MTNPSRWGAPALKLVVAGKAGFGTFNGVGRASFSIRSMELGVCRESGEPCTLLPATTEIRAHRSVVAVRWSHSLSKRARQSADSILGSAKSRPHTPVRNRERLLNASLFNPNYITLRRRTPPEEIWQKTNAGGVDAKSMPPCRVGATIAVL